MPATWRRNRSREPELLEVLAQLGSDPDVPPQYWEAQKPLGTWRRREADE